jgi:hypothetical protein
VSLQWYDFVGLAGVGFVLVSFFLLQAGRLAGDSFGYQLANLFGAIFILISIFGPGPDFRDVISTTIMQLAWMAISLYGLWRGVKLRAAKFRQPKVPPGG